MRLRLSWWISKAADLPVEPDWRITAGPEVLS